MPIVRALTLHVKSGNTELRDAVRILEALRRSLEMGGISVWTLRISLSEDFDWRDAAGLCESGVLIAAYHKRVEEIETQELADYLKKCSTGYATILASGESLEVLPKLYLELSKSLREDYFTRIGVSYGGYVETPYFPISTAFRDAASLAYRYVDLLVSTEPSQWVTVIRSFVERISTLLKDEARELGLRVYHDLSLSPWMSESVVDVIEKLGVLFPRVGSLGAVYRVNSILAGLARSVESTGFNELMLPVAEDNRLKDLVRTGELRIEDLVALSTACVAGLDMAAVPRDQSYLKRVFDDTYTAFSIKKRPYGVRVIPTHSPVINLPRFGELPSFK